MRQRFRLFYRLARVNGLQIVLDDYKHFGMFDDQIADFATWWTANR